MYKDQDQSLVRLDRNRNTNIHNLPTQLIKHQARREWCS